VLVAATGIAFAGKRIITSAARHGRCKMIHRKTFPVDEHCEIALTTERMSDGAWGVVASVKHFEGAAERVTDLPVPVETFATENDAEAFGLRQARQWLAANAPPPA
jgi:hypothetical protein